MDPMVLGCFGVSPFQKPSFAYDTASTKGLQRWWSHDRHTSFVGWFNVSMHKIDREIKKSTYRWKRWKTDENRSLFMLPFSEVQTKIERPSWCQPFVHCCQVRPGPVFFSNGSLYPLAEISGNLEVSSKSFFGIVSSCFGSKTCLKSTAEKNRKSLPMPARSVSCPLHSQRKIDNPFLS